MLRAIIRDALVSLDTDANAIDETAENIVTEVKNLAKKLFFEGKINDLKDYIFDIESERIIEIEKRFIENINFTKSREFLFEMKRRIQTETQKTGREKNIESLLDILDYGHLKGFLSMFTV